MSDFDVSKVAAAAKEMAERKTPVERVREAILNGDALTIHPGADLFPLMSKTDPEGFDSLKEDVASQNTVNESIKINADGVVLDGRNRIAVISSLIKEGITPIFQVEQLDLTDEDAWIASTNLHRRHLSTSQRTMLAAELADRTGKTVKTVSEELNVSPRSVKRAKKIVDDGDAGLKEEVRSGQTSVAKAAEKVTGKKQGSKTKAEVKQEVKKEVEAEKKPVAEKPTAVGELTNEELDGLKKTLVRASSNQLAGLYGYINGLMKAASRSG